MRAGAAAAVVVVVAAVAQLAGARPGVHPARDTFLAQHRIDFARDSPQRYSGRRGVVRVDPRTQWGTWEGWGTSLCWWANVFGQSDALADVLFTRSDNVTLVTNTSALLLPGLALNIARYNAGGSSSVPVDGARMVASPHIPAWKQIQGFWRSWESDDPASAAFDWSVDANQRAMLLRAQARGADRLQLFSNSPMWWACTNHNPSGSPTGATDNLQAWNHDRHAEYLALVAARARDHWGVAFESAEALNEPIAHWWKADGRQEGCHFEHATQANVSRALRAALDRRNLTSVRVAASDENTYDMALATWQSFGAATRRAIGQVDVHGYQQGGGRRDLLYAAVNGTRLWNSEYGESDATGMSLASNLNLDLRWLHNTAWVYWQALDGSDWGLIDANPGAHWVGDVHPKFFVLAQYSRHVQPGMRILDSGDTDTVAALGEDGRLVLVTANYNTAQTIAFDLSAFATVAGPATRWCTVTTAGGERYARHDDVVLGANKTLSLSFAPQSVQTVVIEGVAA